MRELENALEYATAVSKGQTLQPEDLPDEIGTSAGEPGSDEPVTDLAAGSTPSDPSGERARLRLALNRHQWNRNATAAALGISRTTLWRRRRELRLLD